MRPYMSLSALIVGTALAVATPTASAECNISQTKCAVNGGKCNIKFRNVTDQRGGSAGGTKLTQKSSAQIIRVKAVKANGKAAGNIINVESGTSKTMNLDKKAKKDFDTIRISSPTMATVSGVTMSCEDVKAVLDGTGTCKVFNGATSKMSNNFKAQLGYSCDAGEVSGPE